MKVAIRPADLKSDERLIIDTLLRFLTPLSDSRRFSWLYENNPHGRARAWIAHDADDDTIIGISAAFPRRIYVDGKDRLSWVLGDFCINNAYRTLGPALSLQRASLADADSAEVAFCYDFPSKAMTAVYKRLQVTSFGRMIRLAKPLRSDRKMKELTKSPTFSRALSFGGNLLLRLSQQRNRADCDLQLSLHDRDCGDEFSDLARSIGSRYGVCIQRSAEYLNWRYVNSPLYRYELITVRRAGALLGYAVFLQEGEDAMLVDLFGAAEDAVLSALVVHGVALMMTRGVQTLSAGVVESHPWRGLLEHHGFRAREVSPMMIYASSGSEFCAGIKKQQTWLLMQGDRDS
jgi:hypothetical protein